MAGEIYALTSQIQVFPQSNRTQQTPPSNLLTEDAIAGITRHITDNPSYGIDLHFDDGNPDYLTMVLGGYYFKVNFTSGEDTLLPGVGQYLKATLYVENIANQSSRIPFDDSSDNPPKYKGVEFTKISTTPTEYQGELTGEKEGHTCTEYWLIVLYNNGSGYEIPEQSKIKITTAETSGDIDCGTLP